MDYFADIVGQTQAVSILKRAIAQNKLPPAYLFVGMGGVGRRTTARALVQTLMGKLLHPDLLWVEPTYVDKGKLLTAQEAESAGLSRKTQPQIRIEQIREVSAFLGRLPIASDRALVVIESAETMAEGCANALLKTLEEPGAATIILIAPHVGSVLPTLVSRCQKVPFWGLSQKNMQTILDRLPIPEIPPEIRQQAEGSVGRAIQSWQILQTISPELLPQIPSHPLQALQIAKTIATLELGTQLWLMDYWQSWLWQKLHCSAPIQKLEQAKQHLHSFVQPRLVWEVCLTSLLLSSNRD